jgi:hypothetical protein
MDTRRYRLRFARYKNFKSGAQPSKQLLGMDSLEFYLVEIGFTPRDAKFWIRQAHERQYITIPNVMMPQEQIVVYERSDAA